MQSTDKNFMVPVGGAIVASPSPAFIAGLSAIYPGRASMAPVLDLLITLLAMGEMGYRQLLAERKRLIPVLRAGLKELCDRYGLAILPAAKNSISMGVSLDAIDRATISPPTSISSASTSSSSLSFLGSMLFQRSVSGCRVVVVASGVGDAAAASVAAATARATTLISGYSFTNWGSHLDQYLCSYFTVACSIGTTEEELSSFLQKAHQTIGKFKKKLDKDSSPPDENSKSSDVDANAERNPNVNDAGQG